MKRTIIEINEEKCVGCGLCAGACEQGAIQMIDGKAKLMSDSYCDGLGMCLPSCPVDAIKLTEKDVDEFNEERKGFAKKGYQNTQGCGGSKEMTFDKEDQKPKVTLNTVTANPFNTVSVNANPFAPAEEPACGCGSAHEQKFEETVTEQVGIAPSQLKQWPVQITLANTNATFFEDSNLLIAADCVAYAYGNFHADFIKGKVTLIGCPKLDDLDSYIEKLSIIFRDNNINSVTVVKMSVPCCNGITAGVKKAMEQSGKQMPYLERTVTPDGKLV